MNIIPIPYDIFIDSLEEENKKKSPRLQPVAAVAEKFTHVFHVYVYDWKIIDTHTYTHLIRTKLHILHSFHVPFYM